MFRPCLAGPDQLVNVDKPGIGKGIACNKVRLLAAGICLASKGFTLNSVVRLSDDNDRN